MNPPKHGFLLLGLLLSFSTLGLAQQYTLRDQEEIAYQAQLTLSMYKDLLNVISYADLASESEIKELIRNSYTDSRSQLFYSPEAIIEDNIKPSKLQALHVQDKTVKDYLQYFDLAYVKSAGPSIDFYDFQVSDLKYGNHLYIKVKYTCLFKGKHKEDPAAYQANDRVAEFRVEKRENNWKTYITSILYYDPAKPVSSEEGNVALVQSFSDSGAFAYFSDQVNQGGNMASLTNKQAEGFSEKKKAEDSLFHYHLKTGTIALENKNLEGAYAAFSEAEKIYPFHQDLWQKLLALSRAQNLQIASKEKRYEFAKLNADKAYNARDYVKAKSLYTEAMRLSPETQNLQETIEQLEQIIQKNALLESKYAIGEYKEAIVDYNKAIENDPDNPDLFHGRGKCFAKLNAVSEALSDYSTAIELDGNFIAALGNRAQLYTELEQYHRAVADYTLILSNPDYTAEYYPERARLKEIMGDLHGAVEDYNAAIRERPEVADHFFSKGMILLKQRRMGEALSVFNQALEREPDHVNAVYQRGLASAALQDLQAASADFERARGLGLDSSQLAEIQHLSVQYFTLGEEAMQTSRYRQALESFTNALLLSPAFSQAWLRKGDACYMLESYDSAIIQYEKAAEYDHVSLGYFKRGLAYQQMGDEQAARQDFNRYILVGKEVIDRAEAAKKDKKNSETVTAFTVDLAEAYYALGYAQWRTHQYVEALTNLDRALRIKKSYPEAFFARGSALFALDDYKGAIRDLEKSIKLGMPEPQSFYLLGRAYLLSGKPEEAISRYSYYINLFPKHAAAFEERAICYKNIGQYALALDDIKTALSQDKALHEDVELITDKGLMELYLNKFREARQSFDQALRLDEADGWALYGKACVLAQEYKTEESLAFFRKAFQSGQIEWNAIKNDPLIIPISKEKAFQELVQDYLKS